MLVGLCLLAAASGAQEEGGSAQREGAAPRDVRAPQSPEGDELSVQSKLEVQPTARDEEIRARIHSVLETTDWFADLTVRVEHGVVFLGGEAETEDVRTWAGNLARNTRDVAAVVNEIEAPEPSPWDFSATSSGVSRLWRDFLGSLPFVIFGLLILALSAVAGLLVMRFARRALERRIGARLLRGLLARAAGLAVFLLGLYIVLRVAGLTQLALTVVGGTGLVGLALGIAFRDITENYLASIFLSVQRPFKIGDLIDVADVTGYVRQLNVRTTVLMAEDGNLLEVPNSAVYKSTICNFTANPNRRESFAIGIGYDDPIEPAQEIAQRVLEQHPAVLGEPGPWVLVDSLGASTVNLRIYFWFNGREHNNLKMRSSAIRLVKRAFQQNGISMPDEAREVVFPQGIPITMADAERPGEPTREDSGAAPAPGAEGAEEVSTRAEAGLSSDAEVLEEQARQAPLDEHADLLRPGADERPPA